MISSPPPVLSSSHARRPVLAAASRPAPSVPHAHGRVAAPLAALVLVLFCLYLLATSHLIPLLLFLVGLALTTTFLPVTGPRGRQVRVHDGAGLASMLLLPTGLAPLPLLFAGVLFAATRQTRTAKQEVLIEVLCRGAAVLVGGAVYFQAAHGVFSLGAALTASLAYGLVACGGRAALLRARRQDWGLEAVTLAACAMPALLMARLWPALGWAGLGASTLLLALLLLVAHFGFEAALLREQVRAMERLSGVTLAQDNRARLITRFLQLGGALVSAHRMSLWLADTDFSLERVARLQADWSEEDGSRTQMVFAGPARVRLGEGLVGRVAERRLPLIVRDGGREPRAAESERRDWPDAPFSLLMLPLAVGGDLVGVVQFERDEAHAYTRRDLERVQALAAQAAAAIVNGEQHQDITTQAVTDGLTGLFNRRHVQAALDSEHRRAQRYGHPLSVIMLDIDTFKSYNDTYGHTQGDALIKTVASLLRASVRGVDIVGRYGGEEFIVLMPETTKEEAGHTAERLRHAVASTSFPGFADDPDMAVFKTISLGVATLPGDAADAAMLVTLADKALYQAKRGGRNRVALA